MKTLYLENRLIPFWKKFMTKSISNNDGVIDSREVIERLEELETEREAIVDAIDECEDPEQLEVLKADLEEFDDDGYKALKAFAEEGDNNSCEWTDGVTLIREDYFVGYCEELVTDTGDLPRDVPQYIVIDWDATARNLRSDYSEIEWDGVTYLARC